jgi:hypothetical protein
LYFIKFMKSRIHDIRTKRMFRNHFIGHNGEI